MTQFEESLDATTNLYTGYLRECEEAPQCTIERSNDNGANPYQWKITSADSSRLFRYVIFDGPEVNGSDDVKRKHLCSLLVNLLKYSKLEMGNRSFFCR